MEKAADRLDAALYGVESSLVRMIDPVHPMYMPPKTVSLRLQELLPALLRMTPRG
ncbi:MAG: hypothetical protein ACREVO_01535 [Steroidobacteraceae bacterium]